MIHHGSFPTEPWAVRETELLFDELAQRESVFALANGHVGLRGNLDEGEPFGLPGTYLSGFYEVRPLPYGESAYGYPEAGQTIVNVTNGKLIRLLVEDEPFDVRYGVLERHERVLDLRAGVLRRICEWSSPAHTRVRITSTRLVSFTQRAVAAIAYEVEPLDGPTPVVLQSELVANEELPVSENDPRAAAAVASPLRSLSYQGLDDRAVLMHETRASGLRIGAAMDHIVAGPEGTETSVEAFPDVARLTVVSRIEKGQPLRLVKFIAYGWSARRSLPAIRDQVAAALAEARHTGWEGMLSEQRAYLDDFWERADVEVQGDAELQQAVRFALFHTLQAGARSERRAIGAKGLTGPGYDGHTFWDTETFVLPVLTYTAPQAAADALRWRQSTLDLARERAAQLGLKGSAFPWRTIRGQECSGYWPAGTAAFHINADIADAVARYWFVTGDEQFERDVGLELLVETARLWRSLGHHDMAGHFRIDGVTGPDEYSAIADNNVYTNLMAQANLRSAADAAERHRARAHALGVDNEELASWRDAADDMLIPYDEDLASPSAGRGIHSARCVGLRGDPARELPADAALPLLRPVPQAGRQAGGPGARAAPAGGCVQRGGEGARLRLLRTADRARLVAVVVSPGGRRSGGRAHDAGLRVSARVRADGPGRPPAQHPQRTSHRVAGGHLVRAGRRPRRAARPRWPAELRAPPAAAADPAHVPAGLPPAQADGRHHARARRSTRSYPAGPWRSPITDRRSGSAKTSR